MSDSISEQPSNADREKQEAWMKLVIEGMKASAFSPDQKLWEQQYTELKVIKFNVDQLLKNLSEKGPAHLHRRYFDNAAAIIDEGFWGHVSKEDLRMITKYTPIEFGGYSHRPGKTRPDSIDASPKAMSRMITLLKILQIQIEEHVQLTDAQVRERALLLHDIYDSFYSARARTVLELELIAQKPGANSSIARNIVGIQRHFHRSFVTRLLERELPGREKMTPEQKATVKVKLEELDTIFRGSIPAVVEKALCEVGETQVMVIPRGRYEHTDPVEFKQVEKPELSDEQKAALAAKLTELQTEFHEATLRLIDTQI